MNFTDKIKSLPVSDAAKRRLLDIMQNNMEAGVNMNLRRKENAMTSAESFAQYEAEKGAMRRADAAKVYQMLVHNIVSNPLNTPADISEKLQQLTDEFRTLTADDARLARLLKQAQDWNNNDVALTADEVAALQQQRAAARARATAVNGHPLPNGGGQAATAPAVAVDMTAAPNFAAGLRNPPNKYTEKMKLWANGRGLWEGF